MSRDRRERWRRAAREARLTPDEEAALFEHALPIFRRRGSTPGPGGLGGHRIGGRPDLPSELAWPRDGDAHLTFVAQVDLGALEPGWVPELPDAGWLWFFLGVDQPASDVTHRVLFWEGRRDALAPADPPGPPVAVDRPAFRPIVPRFEPSFTFERDVERELGLEEFTLERFEPGGTELGGLPVWWMADAREDAQLFASGLGPLLYHTHQTPAKLRRSTEAARKSGDPARLAAAEERERLLERYRADETRHRAEAKRWRWLLTLGSEADADMCWWDAGYLHFLIHQEALWMRDFHETYCCVATS